MHAFKHKSDKKIGIVSVFCFCYPMEATFVTLSHLTGFPVCLFLSPQYFKNLSTNLLELKWEQINSINITLKELSFGG